MSTGSEPAPVEGAMLGMEPLDAEEAGVARAAHTMLATLVEDFMTLPLADVPIDRSCYGEEPAS